MQAYFSKSKLRYQPILFFLSFVILFLVDSSVVDRGSNNIVVRYGVATTVHPDYARYV